MENYIAKEIKNIIDRQNPWDTPQMLQKEIESFLRNQKINFKCVKALGNVKKAKIFCLFSEQESIMIERDGSIRESVTEDEIYNITNLPKVVLINLCQTALRPVPRLNLSTGTIASYLRKMEAAEVTILDMQMGIEFDYILKRCKEIKPDFIGLSVDFKEYRLSETLLDALYGEHIEGIKVLGNIIPFILAEEYLRKYPDCIISYGEGENAWYDLCKWKKGEISLSQVSGIEYMDGTKMKKNPIVYIDLGETETPALDTLEELKAKNGILTLETSRGCDYSACTFCPRQHKSRIWRGMPPEVAVSQISDLLDAADRIGLPKYIYLADEEMVGELPDGTEYKRINEIGKGIQRLHMNCTLNASVRADSLYNPEKSRDYKKQVIESWRNLYKAGLKKLFIGVESGTEEQLKRYGKGTKTEQNIMAIRTATAVGIEVRTGFIMFDPLMENWQELTENLKFLNRTDAVMKKIEECTDTDVLLEIIENNRIKEERLTGQPIYELISYLFTGLEVFVNAPYYKMVSMAEKEKKKILLGNCNKELGKVETGYLNKDIENLKNSFEEWVNKYYSFTYTLKSLAKSAQLEEEKFLYRKIYEYRTLLYQLGVCLIHNGDKELKQEALTMAEHWGFSLESGTDEIMKYWDLHVMKDYLQNLKKEIAFSIEDVEKKKLLYRVIGDVAV